MKEQFGINKSEKSSSEDNRVDFEEEEEKDIFQKLQEDGDLPEGVPLLKQ